MEKIQLRLTADEAEEIAAILAWYVTDSKATGGSSKMAAQAARLNHLAARARARAAAAAGR